MPDNVRALRGGGPPPPRVKAPAKAPSAPSWLDREAKAEWRRVVPELDRLGVLATIDRAVLATYCAAWSRFVQLEQLLQDEGLIQRDSRGDARKHPAWQQWREAATVVATVGRELMLTPASRLRAVKPEGPDDDDDGGGILD
ncbi:phage terminase small subunit P27 family [Streptomyces sp. 3MP-14]|uniref:Phage terminase small subunit P27 family n=1 Tax=Streptomyces mimosae TaxID=2586635 RepID=A0A5N6AEH4_9ACTN|nr:MULTISPECIES: phage terminase small subunit P27 family [Streptomyces]KAB8167051.1 phage terminase small subunit P27 family [Streptomyces mimosae]KAB8176992.1 phage terminase small subunit P27 family [Streptomyces sp. 3MP-14]